MRLTLLEYTFFWDTYAYVSPLKTLQNLNQEIWLFRDRIIVEYSTTIPICSLSRPFFNIQSQDMALPLEMDYWLPEGLHSWRMAKMFENNVKWCRNIEIRSQSAFLSGVIAIQMDSLLPRGLVTFMSKNVWKMSNDAGILTLRTRAFVFLSKMVFCFLTFLTF